MFERSIKLFVLLTACLATVDLSQARDEQARDALGGIKLSEVRSYRKMFRVNGTPVDMVEETKTMCAPPSLMYGVHYDPGVVYYINEIAKQGIKTFSKNKMFPVGSIIVKEKQERRTEDSVRIITVMKKVLPGNSENSWEYKMFDTKTWGEIDSSSRGAGQFNKTCIECHRRYKNNDYVSDKGIELLLGK